MSKNRFFLISLLIVCLFTSLGCKKSAKDLEPLRFAIPEKWSLMEDTQRTLHHRKIALMTSTGDYAELALLKGDQAFSIDIRDYMSRYIKALFPTEEISEKTQFELGDVSREGHAGYFMHVIVPGKTQVQFTSEFYQFATKNYNLFVALTINPNLTPEQQAEFNQFLASISLGE